eukprot:m.778834 g.778834  ORF g.778834 m.778834 type:complete len:92 (-) comp59124_c0_seq3:3425-3700(-)
MEQYLNKDVCILTQDGHVYIGTLRGFDQLTNIIIEKCRERVFASDGTVEQPLGLFVIRGDNLAIVGELDPDLEEGMTLAEICAEPLNPVVY